MEALLCTRSCLVPSGVSRKEAGLSPTHGSPSLAPCGRRLPGPGEEDVGVIGELSSSWLWWVTSTVCPVRCLPHMSLAGRGKQPLTHSLAQNTFLVHL